jgi:hypothetical protein
MCRKCFQHGAEGFTFPLKEGLLRILSPLKIHRPRQDLKPRTFVPIARTLTIAPSKTNYKHFIAMLNININHFQLFK